MVLIKDFKINVRIVINVRMNRLKKGFLFFEHKHETTTSFQNLIFTYDLLIYQEQIENKK